MSGKARNSVSVRGLSIISVLAVASSVPGWTQTDVLTWHNDNGRTGQNLTEGILSPANVNSSKFGKLFNVVVDGKVDAQPLYVSALNIAGHRHNVVFAATEHDSVYAFDADTGHVYWHTSLLKSGETTSDTRDCGQLVPEIGVTATPVIDPRVGQNGAIYLVAMSKDRSGNYYQRLHALDLSTGAEISGGPATIQASYPGHGDNSSNGKVVFDAKAHLGRPALLLVNGVVYASFGSHCDIRPYSGWSIAYRATDLRPAGAFNFAPNGSEAAAWNAGGGPAADSNGFIYYSLANGSFETTLDAEGFPSKRDFGNSVVKLGAANGDLFAADYWAMYNAQNESSADVDLGSGGIMALPDQTEANGKVRYLVVTAGKDGNIYLADRANLGKFVPNSNSSLYQELSNASGGRVFSSPAYFNGNVFYGAVNSPIRSFPMEHARLLPQTSTTGISFVFPGATPSISAYGKSNAILWALENANPAVLHAYNPANLQSEYYNSNQAGSGRDHFGPGNKYIVPTIANGKVFVGTTNSVAVFGLLSAKSGPVPDGDFLVRNQASNLVLDNPKSSSAANQQIIEWEAHGSVNQSWMFSSQGNGYYLILNAGSGLYLADQTGTADGPLVQQQRSASDSQLWSLIRQGSGYVIKNKHSGLVIDNPRASTTSGTGIILYPQKPAASGTNQTWIIE